MKRLIPPLSFLFLSACLLLGLLRAEEHQVNYGFDLGLDLAGGTQLTYQADISELDPGDIGGVISSLQTVLERRLNALGSSDIRITTEQSSIFSPNNENYYRVNIEIPGVFDPTEAKELIGKIPTLEFRLGPSSVDPASFEWTPSYQSTEPTGISGKQVVTAVVSRTQHSVTPTVDLTFDSEGGDLFFELTRDNVLHYLVIFLDGEVISSPVIQTAIAGGITTISGNFTYETAGELASNLKFGALPVPIDLIATQSISPTLGQDIIDKGLIAGVYALVIIALVMLWWYRLAGLIALFALALYTLLLLAYFKFTGTDMTASGIAGVIVTLGMAVDANILIFERIREEMVQGTQNLEESIRAGFSRAWTSIRDGNISSIMVAIILYYFTTSFVKGFALAFGVGVLLSMFTAVVVTRSLLLAVALSLPKDSKLLVGKIAR